MGLETSTYISGLTASWPLAGDTKSQGDDHLRLIKATLQATFPNASKSFYFPSVAINALVSQTFLSADNNKTFFIDSSGGSKTAFLPVLAGADAGFQLQVVKADGSSNSIYVYPQSGSIVSRIGSTGYIRVGVPWEPSIFVWTGGAWICYKPGVVIGSIVTMNVDVVPPGFFEANGVSFISGDNLELFTVLGASVLPDLRGRVEVGKDGGAGRTTTAVSGFGDTVGSGGGAQTVTLLDTQMPVHFHTASIFDPGHTHTGSGRVQGANVFNNLDAAQIGGNNTGSTFTQNLSINSATTGVRVNSGNGLDTTNNAGGGQAHTNMPPAITMKKLIRAC